MPRYRSIAVFILMTLLMAPSVSLSREKPKDDGAARDQLELVAPDGVVQIEPMRLTAHPASLEGKTVLLRWNGKHNGDRFMKRVGELLSAAVPGVRIIKSWEASPATIQPISGSQERSVELMKPLAALKPDLVIGAQAD